jgi:hypothetical protein
MPDTLQEPVAEVCVTMGAWLVAAHEAGYPLPEPRYRPQHEEAE